MSDDLRKAFDSDSVPLKNIALRKAADRIESLMVILAMERDKSLSLGRYIDELEAALRDIDEMVMGSLHLPMTTLNDVSRMARKALEGKDENGN